MKNNFNSTRRKMAVPLDIVKSPRKLKGLRFKASRTPSRQSSPPHPLDALENGESLSDSETDSFLESSYNESISSVTTSDTSCFCSPSSSCCSWNPASLRPISLVPVVSTSCIAAYSPQSPDQRFGSSSKLTDLLKKSQTQIDQQPKSNFSYAFPNTSKLTAWQVFSAFFISYSMRSGFQKDSGEGFPEAQSKEFSDTQDASESADEELQTFAENNVEPCEIKYHRSKARNREYRVNSDFLKRYAMDCNARLTGILPITADDVSKLTRHPCLRKFDAEYGLNKLSDMSRDKLWNSVILPPRKDACPRNVINSENYVLSKGEIEGNSIIAKYSIKVPWATHQDSMKPAGRLRTCACVKSKSAPTLGHSTPQYTVKGWENERWVSV